MQPSQDHKADRRGSPAATDDRPARARGGGRVLVPFCFFIVDQAEYAVVTQFGEPVQVVTAPGLGLKHPYQSVNKFDRRLFVYAPPLGEFLTLEKTAVVASSAILGGSPSPGSSSRPCSTGPEPKPRLSDILSPSSARRSVATRSTAFVSVAARRLSSRDVLAEVTRTCARHRAPGLRHRGGRRPAAAVRFPRAQPAGVYARMKSERRESA